ncbi:MAG: hypothetical protein R3190_08740 [Thermoanaerobaculia bacterium]|nr:hypothetical protein [Thermoanaerobaculia bacterium]
MLRPLDDRDGYRLFEIGTLEDLDLATLLPMLDAAWALDYEGQPRLVFDRDYLEMVTGGDAWLGVLATTEGGAPVGFELAFERCLYVRGRPLKAYYVSIFTVAADHRRRGLGSWVLEGINRLVFDEHGADLILSTFHEGHAGSPTVQSTFDRIADWGVSRFHPTRIWSRRLDKDPLLPLDETPAGTRVVVDDDTTELRPVDESGCAIDPPSRASIEEGLRSGFDLAFSLRAGFAARYLAPGETAARSRLYDFGGGAACLVSYNLMHMAIDDHRLRPIGQLQTVWAPACSEEQVRTAVHDLGLRLTVEGCFAMTLLDAGMVPRPTLEALRFRPADDGVAFAARGPRSNLDSLAGSRPPYFLDFT